MILTNYNDFTRKKNESFAEDSQKSREFIYIYIACTNIIYKFSKILNIKRRILKCLYNYF
jgi:hypothetical protein